METLEHIIIKLDDGKYQLNWSDDPLFNEAITIDFNPLIEEFKLREKYSQFCLVHFQAKPKFKRRWGLYCSDSGNYYSVEHAQILTEQNESQLLQIDESKIKRPPNAVILYPNCKVIIKEEKHILENLIKQ